MPVQKRSGFTIVELLIVIVVIAILAAISIVAYNGIQQRAQNTKTIAAVHDWAQALRLYKVDHGDYPRIASCLGVGYGQGFSGNESSGGECRQDLAGGGGAVMTNSTFLSLMSDYVNGNPSPSLVTAGSSDFPWYRGAYTYVGVSGVRIDFVLAGSSTPCPSIPGLSIASFNAYAETNSVACRGLLEGQ